MKSNTFTSVDTIPPTYLTNSKRDSSAALPDNKREPQAVIIQKVHHSTDTLPKKNGEHVSLLHRFKKEERLTKTKAKQVHHKDGEPQEDDIREPSILIQSNRVIKQKESSKADSVALKKNTLLKKDTAKNLPILPAASDSANKKIKKKQPPVLSAGIGFHQFITLADQQASPYNFNGTKNFLTDHFPSLYVKWQHNKWDAQADVAYIVAQPVRKFFFSETTQIDSAANTSHTERFAVQKLYYHQLAISINRTILPNWSVGVGGLYNLLAGSVKAKQTTNKNLTTGQESIMEKIDPVKGGQDSLLVDHKSIASILLQTNYLWKRFSIGLRYTKSLQPYLEYNTLVDVRKEKNQMLEAVLRVQLWKKR